MCELWLFPPVASYFKRGQKIAAFGMEMEEQGMGKGECACSSFRMWFTLVAMGTPRDAAARLQVCSLNCANSVVWQHQHFWLEAVAELAQPGLAPTTCVPAGCASWCA